MFTDRDIETDMLTHHRETIIIAKRTEKITTFYPVASSNSHLGGPIAKNRKQQPRGDSMRFRSCPRIKMLETHHGGPPWNPGKKFFFPNFGHPPPPIYAIRTKTPFVGHTTVFPRRVAFDDRKRG